VKICLISILMGFCLDSGVTILIGAITKRKGWRLCVAWSLHLLGRRAPKLYGLTYSVRSTLQMLNALTRRLEVTPRHKTPKPCGDDALLAGRGPSQMGWYRFIAELVEGHSVLDVGCGSGEGLKVLAMRASYALGIDLDDRLRRSDVNVEIKSVTDVPDKSFDYVVCLDVVEHVEQDRAFVAELFRVARVAVFVSTPNYAMSFNRNPYHVREYTPRQFERLFEGYGALTLYAGTAKGLERVELTRRTAYFLVSSLYQWKPTVVAAKVLKRLLGVRVWGHQAALVRLSKAPARATAAA
jgi:SAM-dependent methyltransferase